MRRLLLALTALSCLALFRPAARADEPFRFPEGKRGDKAVLKYVNGLPVLLVCGTPEEMGDAAGALALKPASRVLGYPRELLKALSIDRAWGFFVGSGRGMFKRFPPEYQKELEALARAAGADRDAVIAGNTFFDLKKVLACSALLIDKEKSATGAPLLARNLDYPSLGYIHQYSLVTVYRPNGKKAFATVGFPGLIGCLSGMNADGLTLAVLEVFDIKAGQQHFDSEGIPYGLCLRRVLEEASTIDQAVAVLEKLRRTTTLNVILADRSGVAVLEVSPKKVLRRAADKGVLVCTNHYCSPLLRADRPVNVDRSFERFATLEGVRSWREKARPEDLRKPLDEVNLGTLTLQTMVFEPAALRLHLSIGSVPASRGPLKTLDLAPLFKGKIEGDKGEKVGPRRAPAPR